MPNRIAREQMVAERLRPESAQLLTRLLVLCDENGWIECTAGELYSRAYPFGGKTLADVERALVDLETRGVIVRTNDDNTIIVRGGGRA